MKDVLVINSYGGSLLLGAKAAGLPIQASYEDGGFGMEAQKLNFPELTFVEKLPWPEKTDLSDSVVIAHPPCAPFSIMNPMKGKKDESKAIGTTADGFQCHRNVMEYSLSRGAKALAIESVPGVLKDANAVEEYKSAAEKYGYHVYFLQLNSISFGVPQWRPRVWIIFMKNSEGIQEATANLPHGDCFKVSLQPVYRKLESILQTEGTCIDMKFGKYEQPSGSGESNTNLVLDRMLGKSEKRTGGGETHIIIRRLQEAKIDPQLMREMFEGTHGAGTILQLGKKILGVSGDDNFKEVRDAWGLGGLYAAMMPRILDPGSWAPTVLGGSAWFINGRPLLLEEYNLIMGFPKDYQWPDSYSDPRLYLSKGVCPPVATWILNQIRSNIELGWEEWDGPFAKPSETLDLQPKRADVQDILDGKPVDASQPVCKIPKVKKLKAAKEAAVMTPRTKTTASNLAASFLDGITGGTI